MCEQAVKDLSDKITATDHNLVATTTTLNSVLATLGELKGAVESLKARPATMWDKLIYAVVGAITAAVIILPPSRHMKTQGISINKQHVLNIMHELGLEAMSEGAKKSYKQKREQHTNRVKREFSVDKPNKVWVSDITYFNCGGKSMYICVVIDLYSRMVVGHTISKRESKQIVSSALKKAIEFRTPKAGLIFHSDRGGQYTADSFQNLLKKNGMEQSLSASGKPYDNAVAESFFSIIKKEELYRHQYRSVHDFQESVDHYIEYYNTTRVHSFLGYISPLQFEAKYCCKK